MQFLLQLGRMNDVHVKFFRIPMLSDTVLLSPQVDVQMPCQYVVIFLLAGWAPYLYGTNVMHVAVSALHIFTYIYTRVVPKVMSNNFL